MDLNLTKGQNPVVKLNEYHQKKHGQSPAWSEPKKEGPDHLPKITVSVETQWGKFTKTGEPGENQRIVRQKLAVEALNALGGKA